MDISSTSIKSALSLDLLTLALSDAGNLDLYLDAQITVRKKRKHVENKLDRTYSKAKSHKFKR